MYPSDEAYVDALKKALEQCIEAFRLTREYLGEDLLPEIEGWAHYDAVVAAREVLYPHEKHDDSTDCAYCKATCKTCLDHGRYMYWRPGAFTNCPDCNPVADTVATIMTSGSTDDDPEFKIADPALD